MGNFIDLSGQVFGRLRVLCRVGQDPGGNVMWRCLCECGREVDVVSKSLRKGETKSCGCLVKDTNTTHGFSRTPISAVWYGAKDRVTNPKNSFWEDYGGRGITMCDEWLNSPGAFHRDMLPSWKPGLTLERKDVNGNYCPENCIWATESVQGHNKRKKQGCSSTYIGVCLQKPGGKFLARIKLNHKPEHLGSFVNELDAAIAYDDRSEELYGDRPNGTVKQ